MSKIRNSICAGIMVAGLACGTTMFLQANADQSAAQNLQTQQMTDKLAYQLRDGNQSLIKAVKEVRRADTGHNVSTHKIEHNAYFYANAITNEFNNNDTSNGMCSSTHTLAYGGIQCDRPSNQYNVLETFYSKIHTNSTGDVGGALLVLGSVMVVCLASAAAIAVAAELINNPNSKIRK